MKKEVIHSLRNLLLSFTLPTLFAGNLYAVSDQLDSSFAVGSGAGYPDPGASNWGQVQAVAVQADGKVIAGGQALFDDFNGTPVPSFVRINVDGSLDTAFQANVGTGPLDVTAPEVNDIVIQPDGKIIIGGPFTTMNGFNRRGVARLNADGSVDTTFLASGGGVAGASVRYVTDVALQPDGKILIAGGFTSYLGTARPGVARLNSDGTLDTSFNPGSPAIFGSQCIGVQPDGKIYVGGGFTNWLGMPTPGIVRLHGNGTLDTSFLPSHSYPYPSVGTLLPLGDGRVLIGGFVEGTEGSVTRYFARLNADGSMDTGYPVGGRVGGWVADIVPWPGGGHLVMGRFRDVAGHSRGELALIDDAGNVDMTFAPPPVTNPQQDIVHIYTGAVAPDGKIVFGGWFTNYPAQTTQLNGQNYSGIGRLIGGYVAGPGTIQFTPSSLQVNEDAGTATITVTRFGGSTGAVGVNFASANGSATAGSDYTATNGTLSWAAGELGSRTVTVAINSDGVAESMEDFIFQLSGATGGATLGTSILTVSIVDDDSVPTITTPPQDTSVLLTFSTSFRVNVGPGLPVTYQWLSNGVAIVNATNAFLSLNNVQTNFATGYSVIVSNSIGAVTSSVATLTVLIPAGLPEPSFAMPTAGFNSDIFKIAFGGDGSLIVGGSFSQFGGVTIPNYIAKINADGSRDTTFPPAATGANNVVQTMAAYPDGKMLIGGNFTQYAGTNRSKVARLNANGSLDLTYSNATISATAIYVLLPQADGSAFLGDSSFVRKVTATGTNDTNWTQTTLIGQVYALAQQADGKILAAPYRSSVPSGAELIRLNTNGTRDFTFQSPGRFAGGQIQGLKLLPDGRILAVGGFTSLVKDETTNAAPYIAVFHPDGTRDTSFNIGTAPDGSIIDAFVQPDGRILVGGAFTTWNGASAGRYIRLMPNGQVDPTFVTGTGANGFVRTIMMDAAGRIAIGGQFSTVNGQTRNRLALITHDAGSVQFTAATRQVNEQGGTIAVSVERVAGSRGAVSVNYATINGTAGASDFTATSGLLTWTNNEYGVKTFDITLNNDSDIEEDETFSIVLTNITGGVGGLFTNQTIQILDNESKPRFSFHPTNIISAEELSVTFTSSAFSALPVTYQWLSNNVIIPNATNSFLTLTNVQTNFAATYLVRASNDNGPTDSSNAVLTIITSPTRRDPTFNVVTAFNGSVHAIYPLGDGRVMVGGSFTQPRNRIVLLNSNGVVDATFTNTATAIGGFTAISDIERDSKGRWLIGGSFGSFGGVSFSNITRLNPDYSVDTNFLAALWMPPDDVVNDITVGPDGKIWVSGSFKTIGGPYGRNSLVRLNENGSLDMSFRARPNNNNPVRRVIPLPDGGAYVCGAFTGWDGVSLGGLVKVFADGTRDTSFNPNTGNSGVYDIILLPDGTLFAAGNNDPRIYKFRPNGSRDTGFLDGVVVNSGAVNSIAMQSNGRLLAGGAFTSFGIHTNRFTRVNADGTQDTSLSLGKSFNGDVGKVALEHGGAIWVGGNFTTYKGSTPAYLIRLAGDESTVAIGQQPIGGVVAPTQNFTFSISAAGSAPLTYQWLKNGSPVSNGGVVSGANTASLTLTEVFTNDAGNYSIIVSNSAGAFATSRAASLQVISVPVITAQPIGGFIPAGGRIALSVGAEGPATLSYFWSKDGSPVGGNSPLYILNNAPTTASGNYQVVVSNSFGAVTSVVASVTVQTTPATTAPGFFTDAGTVNATDTIYALQPMPDGQLMIGGGFSQIKTNGANNTFRQNIALFTTNGGAAAFNPGFDNQVTKVLRQRDGRILVSGNFQNIGANPRRYIARFNADLTFDTNFHNALYRNFNTNGPNFAVNDMALQSDGKILLAGEFTSVTGKPNTRGIARLNTDGSVDESFTSYASNGGGVIEVLPNGKILLVVSGNYNGHSASIYRLHSNGSVDFSFTNSLGAAVTALAVETNGNVLVGGTFTTPHGLNRPILARLLSSGQIDTDFLAGVTNFTAANQAVIRTIAVQENGKILAGGSFITFGPFRNGLARFNQDGTPDSSFIFQQGASDDYNANIWKIALFADGRIAIAGRFPTWEGTAENCLAILNGDSIPLNFASQPVDQFVPANTTLQFSAVAVGTPPISYQWYRGLSALSDGGNISGATTATLTVSNATQADEGMYSLLITNAAGGMRFSLPAELYILDAPEFRTQPVGGTYYVSNSVSLQATVLGVTPIKYEWLFNSNVIAGATNSFLTFTNLALTNAGNYQLVASNALGVVTSAVATLNVLLPPAALSPTWPHPAGASANIYSVLPLGDGRVVIGGQFSSAGTNGTQTAIANLALLNTNGTVDTSFNPAPSGQVEVVRRDANGKFLVVGNFNNIGGQSRSYLARLNSDGSLDTNFLANLGTGPNNSVYDIALQADGKILLGGQFTLVSGQSYPGIVRLNANGTVDTSFSRLNASFPTIYALSLRSDGKIYAGGFVTVSNRQNIVRLENNGAVDLGFMATSSSSITKILPTSDGGALLGGFYSVSINGGANINGLAKLNADGSLNNSWPQTRPDGAVEDMIFQADGKLMVVGQFFNVGIARQRVARYNSDGSLDTSFAPGSGFNQNAYSVALESDGRIWIGGGFTSYNGVTANRLVLLVGDAVAPGGGSPFENWAESAGLTPDNDDPDQDPDNDGVDNVFEFYFGTSPVSSGSSAEPTATSVSSGGQEYPAITFIRVKDVSGVTLVPQASSTVDFTNSLGTTVESILDLGDGTELVTIRSNVNAASQPNQFLRIQLSIP